MIRTLKLLSNIVVSGLLITSVASISFADGEEAKKEEVFQCVKDVDGKKEVTKEVTSEKECTEQKGSWEKVEAAH